jgi:hypothetical protein
VNFLDRKEKIGEKWNKLTGLRNNLQMGSYQFQLRKDITVRLRCLVSNVWNVVMKPGENNGPCICMNGMK